MFRKKYTRKYSNITAKIFADSKTNDIVVRMYFKNEKKPFSEIEAVSMYDAHMIVENISFYC